MWLPCIWCASRPRSLRSGKAPADTSRQGPSFFGSWHFDPAAGATLVGNRIGRHSINQRKSVLRILMYQNNSLLVCLLLSVFAIPLALSIPWYWRKKRLEGPVVRFLPKRWPSGSLLLVLLQALYGLVLSSAALGLLVYLIIAACLLAIPLGLYLFVLGLDVLLMLGAWRCFPALRLYWTYKQYDGRASLIFHRAEQTAVYCSKTSVVNFAMADVVLLTIHSSNQSGVVSADYSYTVLSFADGGDLLVTSLLCDYIDLSTLLPAVKTKVVSRWYAWLPADSLSVKLFGPYF
jgi:hypothetical protein